MRRLLTFGCEGATLGASLDLADGGATGVLMVTGGSQTRIGSHRMYERLAKSLACRGFTCFRFDRRGVGDSEGGDPGFRGSAADLAAAAEALRREVPGLARIIGFGLCDGATALALFAEQARLDGLILVNPWLVEVEADAPAPAAVRAHYADRLKSLEGWKKLLSGSVDYRKLLRGAAKIVRGSKDESLAAEAAAAMRRHRLPAELILAAKDATAIAAEDALRRPLFRGIAPGRQTIPTDSHTFARHGDEEALRAATLTALQRLGG